MKFWPNILSKTKPVSLSVFEWILVLGFFLSLSFGQLGRVEVLSAVIYPHDLIIMGWLFLHISLISRHCQRWWSQRDRVFKRWWPVLALVGWVVLGLGLASLSLPQVAPWLYLARVITYSLFSYSLLLVFRQHRYLLRTLAIIVGSYMAIFGLTWYLLQPDVRFLYLFGWDEHYYRLIGSLLDPNFSGLIFVLTGWYVVSLRQLLPKWLLLTLVAILVVSLGLTFSRASYLSLLLSLVVYFSLQRQVFTRIIKPMLIAGSLVAVIVTALILAPKPGGEGVNLLRTASIQARIENSVSYIGSLEPAEYLFGQGLFSSAELTPSHAQVPDNVLVLVLVGAGIPGLVLFAIVGGKLLVFTARQEPSYCAGFSAVLVHAQFNNSLFEPFVFLLLAIGLASLAPNLGKKVSDYTEQSKW